MSQLLSMLGGGGGGFARTYGAVNQHNASADQYQAQMAQLRNSDNPQDRAKADSMVAGMPEYQAVPAAPVAGAGLGGLRGLLG